MIVSGKEGLKEVGSKDGKWNWCLVGPNPEQLPLVGGGLGPIDELRECLARQEAENRKEQQFANFYGLLRLKFGTGRMSRVKYAFIQASRVDDNAEEAVADGAMKSSAVKQGQAMGQRGAMEKALAEFCHFNVKIEATRLEDLSVENIVEKCQKASTADADMITAESYAEGVADFQEKFGASVPCMFAASPEKAAQKQDDKALTEACVADVFNQAMVPTAEVAEAEQEQADELDAEEHPFPMESRLSYSPGLPDSDMEDEVESKTTEKDEANDMSGKNIATDQGATAKDLEKTATEKRMSELEQTDRKAQEAMLRRTSVAPAVLPTRVVPGEMKKGDLLFVFSNASKQWMDDGLIIQVLDVDETQDGLQLPKNSVKVQYNNRRQFKWVMPTQTNSYLRPSRRPEPPPTLLGELLKETHQWITVWHVRYFELSKGYLQWWMTADDARQGRSANGSLNLTGLQLSVSNTVMHIRTTSSRGMVYAFDATSPESAKKWSEMLQRHEVYCTKMQYYLTQQARDLERMQADGSGDKKVADEKLSGMVADRKRRASVDAGKALAAAAQAQK